LLRAIQRVAVMMSIAGLPVCVGRSPGPTEFFVVSEVMSDG